MSPVVMNDLNKAIRFWGICDLGSIAWFIGWRIFHKQIPFYHDILQSNVTATSFGHPLPSVLTYISIIFYMSLILSGFLLVKRLTLGAILSYIQCPFRLLTFIPPSLFFITWALQYIIKTPNPSLDYSFNHPAIILVISLVLFSEALKMVTVIIWHRKIIKGV
jgi:hypothetical protein